MVIYPYKMRSKSALLLSSALRVKRVRPKGEFRNNFNHIVINWGNSSSTHFPIPNCLNRPQSIELAANKGTAFRCMDNCGVSVPLYWNNKDSAKRYMEAGEFKIVCRTILTGHSGAGIVIASTPDELVDAPLYTQFITKDKEYRVHVFNGKVIDFQQKKRKREVETNDDVRNHSNGWVYARSDVMLPELVAEQSILAVNSLNLNFGAVDVCTDIHESVYVFEVNTAPGIEGTTITKYVEAIKEYANALSML